MRSKRKFWVPVARRPPRDTVFFGGGTPSLLDPDEVARLIGACREAYAVDPQAEITLETNPETATEDRLEAFHRAGVTRLSFGVQSFDDAELARLGRIHSAERARRAVRAARAAGFRDVSFDLMFWLPGQSLASWLATIDEAIALAPDHLSLYLLELYPNAPLKETMARASSRAEPLAASQPRQVQWASRDARDASGSGHLRAEGASSLAGAPAEAGAPLALREDADWIQVADDEAADMYLEALARLDAAGFEQYEISNVARPGRWSRHNVKYWQGGNWRGFGCGAHSTVEGVRWKNVPATADYIDRMLGRCGACDRHAHPDAAGTPRGTSVHRAATLGRGQPARNCRHIRRRSVDSLWRNPGALRGRRPDMGLRRSFRLDPARHAGG